MKKIKVVYNIDTILTDENNQVISYSAGMFPTGMLYEINWLMSECTLEEYQSSYRDMSLRQIMKTRLDIADELKRVYPEAEISFYNPDSYYPMPVDEQGFSVIPQGFSISQYILADTKMVRVMFDYCASGIWDSDGSSVPLEWLPVSEATRELIDRFQRGLDTLPSHEKGTPEEERFADQCMGLGFLGACNIKKELPEWKVNFYNYGSYYDLPVDEYNDSEITWEVTKLNLLPKLVT